MNRAMKSGLAVAVGWALASLPGQALGNVYATNLGQSANTFSAGQTVTLSYLLNEAATGVTVSILNSSNSVVRTITPGAQATGVQSVIWDGKDNGAANLPAGNYSFRVASSGDAKGAWTQIGTDSTLNNFELPRGVAVNTNPNSRYYGRVYVANPRTTATAAGRAMGDGIYMLNADLSDGGIPGGSVPQTGGVDWTTDSGATGPFRLQVGPDDGVYITDWSDQHGGLWQAPADLTGAWTEVLDSTDRDGSGLNSVHGSLSDVVITGTGSNRVIYTADEDYFDINTQSGSSAGSIQRYDIGTTTTWNQPPSATFYDDAVGGFNINFFNSLALDKNGNFWYSQNRSGGTDKASLVQIDPSGVIIWDSLVSLGSPDPLRGTQGIAYDPVNNVLALATNQPTGGGNVIIFDPETKSILTQFAFGATTNTDVVFDNAGNLYVANRTAERVHIWSPPSGTGSFVANQFSTDSLGALGSISLTAGTAPDADFNDNGTVEGQDFLIWQRSFGGPGSPTTGDANGDQSVDATDYNLWKSKFGGAPATAAGGSVPEPVSGVLVVLALFSLQVASRRSR